MKKNIFLDKTNNSKVKDRFKKNIKSKDNQFKVSNKVINKQNIDVSSTENFPELTTVKKEQTQVTENKVWKNAILKTNEAEKKTINVNDPKYWRGDIWIGPIFIKADKYSDRWKNYINKAFKGHASSIIFPCNNIKYSRDDKNWFNSFDETFTTSQRDRIKKQENDEELKRFEKALEKIYHKRKQESLEYYYETGELDYFALAEKERMEYEEYLEELEKVYEDQEEVEERLSDEEDDE
tara:strand:- start:448 stop:1161 length:714 start_codon:yes stop_codon:yes gene_type:complete